MQAFRSCLFALLIGAAAQPAAAWEWRRPATISSYVGAGNEYRFKQALAFKYESAHETMYALSLDWHLPPDSAVNRGAAWLGASIEPAVLVGYRDDRQQDIGIAEAVLCANLRWSNFPWNDSLRTSLAIGWGVSYTSDITANEAEDAAKTDPDEGPQRWLNYLSFEAGFALPRNPNWQLFYRLHHRSGAFGLFADNDVGSNVMGLGVRYFF